MNEYGEFTTTELKNYYDNLLMIKNSQISDLENKINQLEYKHKQIEIPHDLAEAIETYNKFFGNDKEEIIFRIVKLSIDYSIFDPSLATSVIIKYLKQKQFLNIITAIINGYTIKKEPTDILRENIFFVIDDEAKVSKIMELIKKFNESEN